MTENTILNSRKPTAEKPRNIDFLSAESFTAYLLSSPVDRIDDPGLTDTQRYKDQQKAYKLWCLKMFEYFAEDAPGKIVAAKFIRQLMPIDNQTLSVAHYRSIINFCREYLKKQKKTLHNVRGEGYCLATPDQHRIEAIKQFVRGSMFLFSALSLNASPEMDKTEPNEILDSLVETFLASFKNIQVIWSEMSADEHETISSILAGQVLTPDFKEDPEYLQHADKLQKILDNYRARL